MWVSERYCPQEFGSWTKTEATKRDSSRTQDSTRVTRECYARFGSRATWWFWCSFSPWTVQEINIEPCKTISKQEITDIQTWICSHLLDRTHLWLGPASFKLFSLIFYSPHLETSFKRNQQKWATQHLVKQHKPNHSHFLEKSQKHLRTVTRQMRPQAGGRGFLNKVAPSLFDHFHLRDIEL